MGYNTTRNGPYIHPSHDFILELWQTFPNALQPIEYSFSIGAHANLYLLLDTSSNVIGISIHTVKILQHVTYHLSLHGFLMFHFSEWGRVSRPFPYVIGCGRSEMMMLF